MERSLGMAISSTFLRFLSTFRVILSTYSRKCSTFPVLISTFQLESSN